MLSVLHVASDKDNMIFDYIYSDSKESEQEKIRQPFCWVNQNTDVHNFYHWPKIDKITELEGDWIYKTKLVMGDYFFLSASLSTWN